VPDDEGVYLLDLNSGVRTLLHSMEQIAAVNHRPGMDSGLNWVNHLLFNTDGSRLIFLHRWRETESLSGPWSTRMFTLGVDGTDPHIVSDNNMVSHFIWKNPEEILAWSREPETGNRYHFYNDAKATVEVIGEGVLTRDGHCTYSPDGEWILTDTYPDGDRMQHLMLYRPSDGKLVKLGAFYQAREHKGEFRCDLHPRWSRDGKSVVVDSLHTGKRQMYLVDVSGVLN
jgi:Tol biopolymer transport system component